MYLVGVISSVVTGIYLVVHRRAGKFAFKHHAAWIIQAIFKAARRIQASGGEDGLFCIFCNMHHAWNAHAPSVSERH
jgi:hypothetical protein